MSFELPTYEPGDTPSGGSPIYYDPSPPYNEGPSAPSYNPPSSSGPGIQGSNDFWSNPGGAINSFVDNISFPTPWNPSGAPVDWGQRLGLEGPQQQRPSGPSFEGLSPMSSFNLFGEGSPSPQQASGPDWLQPLSGFLGSATQFFNDSIGSLRSSVGLFTTDPSQRPLSDIPNGPGYKNYGSSEFERATDSLGIPQLPKVWDPDQGTISPLPSRGAGGFDLGATLANIFLGAKAADNKTPSENITAGISLPALGSTDNVTPSSSPSLPSGPVSLPPPKNVTSVIVNTDGTVKATVNNGHVLIINSATGAYKEYVGSPNLPVDQWGMCSSGQCNSNSPAVVQSIVATVTKTPGSPLYIAPGSALAPAAPSVAAPTVSGGSDAISLARTDPAKFFNLQPVYEQGRAGLPTMVPHLAVSLDKLDAAQTLEVNRLYEKYISQNFVNPYTGATTEAMVTLGGRVIPRGATVSTGWGLTGSDTWNPSKEGYDNSVKTSAPWGIFNPMDLPAFKGAEGMEKILTWSAQQQRTGLGEEPSLASQARLSNQYPFLTTWMLDAYGGGNLGRLAYQYNAEGNKEKAGLFGRAYNASILSDYARNNIPITNETKVLSGYWNALGGASDMSYGDYRGTKLNIYESPYLVGSKYFDATGKEIPAPLPPTYKATTAPSAIPPLADYNLINRGKDLANAGAIVTGVLPPVGAIMQGAGLTMQGIGGGLWPFNTPAAPPARGSESPITLSPPVTLTPAVSLPISVPQVTGPNISLASTTLGANTTPYPYSNVGTPTNLVVNPTRAQLEASISSGRPVIIIPSRDKCEYCPGAIKQGDMDAGKYKGVDFYVISANAGGRADNPDLQSYYDKSSPRGTPDVAIWKDGGLKTVMPGYNSSYLDSVASYREVPAASSPTSGPAEAPTPIVDPFAGRATSFGNKQLVAGNAYSLSDLGVRIQNDGDLGGNPVNGDWYTWRSADGSTYSVRIDANGNPNANKVDGKYQQWAGGWPVGDRPQAFLEFNALDAIRRGEPMPYLPSVDAIRQGQETIHFFTPLEAPSLNTSLNIPGIRFIEEPQVASQPRSFGGYDLAGAPVRTSRILQSRDTGSGDWSTAPRISKAVTVI